MAWIYLLIAGIFEIGWPLGFKLADVTGNKFLWISIAAMSMLLSGLFLYLAQKEIPIGTAYAVWTGVGAAGTFIIGILFFKDPVGFFRMLSLFLIIAGIVGLRLSSQPIS
jgi:quaternary ammonium compound-resistance protein SugE